MIRVYTNDHWVLERDTRKLLLAVRRSSKPYESTKEILDSFAALEDVLKGYNRKHFVLLVDMRQAPQRNDPAFEQAARGQPVALARDFIRVATVVATASGALQIGRHVRASGIHMSVFSDEASALQDLEQR